MLGHVIKDEDGVRRPVEVVGRESVCITIELHGAKIELYPHGPVGNGLHVLRLSKDGPPETDFEVVMTPEQMLGLSVSLQALVKSTPRREVVKSYESGAPPSGAPRSTKEAAEPRDLSTG